MQPCIKKDEGFWQSLTGGHQDGGLPDAFSACKAEKAQPQHSSKYTAKFIFTLNLIRLKKNALEKIDQCL